MILELFLFGKLKALALAFAALFSVAHPVSGSITAAALAGTAFPTAATQFGVVYSVNTGRVRQIVLPDSSDELSSIKLEPCERMKILDRSHYGTLTTLQDIVSSSTGLVPSHDRYALVDSLGIVRQIIIADPLCGDGISGYRLIQSDSAQVGWVWDSIYGFRPHA